MEHLSAFLCLAIGIAALFTSLALIQIRRRIASDWVQLEDAVVVQSQLETRGAWAIVTVVYDYHSCGVYYQGQEVRRILLLWSNRIEQYMARHAVGSVVTAYVDPDNHQRSVLEPTPPASVCAFGFLCATAGLLGSVFLLAF